MNQEPFPRMEEEEAKQEPLRRMGEIPGLRADPEFYRNSHRLLGI